MFRTVGIVALVAVALIGIAAVEADAHWTIVNGKVTYHSIDCEAVWKNVKNLSETNPAEGVCSPVGTVVEVECANPVGNIVRGTASHPIVFAPASGPAEQTLDEKKKGRGHLNVRVIENHETLDLNSDDFCNNNWTLRALLRETLMTVDLYVPDIQGTLVSTAVFRCVLPQQFNFDNPPEPPLEVSCDLESFTHHQ